ncbi:hypothetical protein Hamer_G020817 [Homarus americanus]|uniref:Pentapeptide repeat-containing protein n=1 Tax=Homarus americanus TaxID=6706 RepID=A0A8J5JTJ4_HOMAM|nr:hypothetical protein Hamer_G020817 [Homarus americanus]
MIWGRLRCRSILWGVDFVGCRLSRVDFWGVDSVRCVG